MLNVETDDFKESIKKRVVPHYISCLLLCDDYAKISMVVPKNDITIYDLETQRSVIFSRFIIGQPYEDEKELLKKNDIYFIEICDLLKNRKDKNVKEKILSFLYDIEDNEKIRYYYILLEMSINTLDLGEYRNYRKELMGLNISCIDLEFYNAQYYEKEGNIEKSKQLYDMFIDKATDTEMLLIAVSFYSRNKFTDMPHRKTQCAVSR